MLTVVTGAAGFIGAALARRMQATAYPGEVRLIDRSAPIAPAPDFHPLALDLHTPGAIATTLAGADRIVHLASLAGAAAEADPPASRRTNLDLTLALIEAASTGPHPARFIQASSIAVFGAPYPAQINDATAPRPATTYGAHKLMAELALADATRRGAVHGLALRLPGIVARPPAAASFASGFLSDLFWALRARTLFRAPVGPRATTWLLSAEAAAEALLHALAAPAAPPALTLPALRVTMAELVHEIAAATGADPALVSYHPDPAIERTFGALPPLATPSAEALGFRHDGSLAQLVRRALGTP